MMWQARAPSNIALIKYMGKSHGNRPTNPSLSYTLDHLFSEVRIEEGSEIDRWERLELNGFSTEIEESGQKRFLEFFARLKKEFGVSGSFVLRSANNFPSDCGLASSASSFAALTKAANELAKDRGVSRGLSAIELSRISRTGSGSSCRSFFSPWSMWHREGAEPIELPIGRLLHVVAIASSSKKEVSSSEAHSRVSTSLLFNGRQLRAEKRMADLIAALRQPAWKDACEIVWQEFWDMHALFETCREPFGYMTADSLRVLELIRHKWRMTGDGPMATMDAGPNVHLLFRGDQREMAREFVRELRQNGFERRVISDDVEIL